MLYDNNLKKNRKLTTAEATFFAMSAAFIIKETEEFELDDPNGLITLNDPLPYFDAMPAGQQLVLLSDFYRIALDEEKEPWKSAAWSDSILAAVFLNIIGEIEFELDLEAESDVEESEDWRCYTRKLVAEFVSKPKDISDSSQWREAILGYAEEAGFLCEEDLDQLATFQSGESYWMEAPPSNDWLQRWQYELNWIYDFGRTNAEVVERHAKTTQKRLN